jgi:protein-L-isoaspartate(D-aspartate) O-methyltransferase
MTEDRRLREELVDGLVARGDIRDHRVEAAFRAVGRHHFLPDRPLEEVYRDTAIPTHRDSDGAPVSSSSQPAIMAVMLEQLDVRAGQRVLEVGAGTGYNAALLGELAGPYGHVVSVDIDPTIVGEARDGLERSGAGNVEAVTSDGAAGWPDGAPYDRVIATCSSTEVPEAWARQLAPVGRIVLPLELRPGVMLSVALEPDGACLRSVSTSPCGFMRIRGSLAAGRAEPLRLPGGVVVESEDQPAGPEQVAEWLRRPPETTPVAETEGTDAFSPARLWVSLTEPGACAIALPPDLAEDPSWPAVWRGAGLAFTWGVLAGDGICLLDRDEAGGMALRTYGGPGAATRFERAMAAWRSAGRPGKGGVRVTICPSALAVQPPAAAHLLRRPSSTVMVEWL